MEKSKSELVERIAELEEQLRESKKNETEALSAYNLKTQQIEELRQDVIFRSFSIFHFHDVRIGPCMKSVFIVKRKHQVRTF